MKTAWLLESRLGGGIIYLGHFADCRCWTPDAIEAVHFADERSANLALRFIKDYVGPLVFVAREHGFDEVNEDAEAAIAVISLVNEARAVEKPYEGEEHA